MDAGAERKFIALKRRLDALHYQQPLSKYWSTIPLIPSYLL